MPHAKKATTPKPRGKKPVTENPAKASKPAKIPKSAKSEKASDAGKTAGTYKKTEERVTLPGQKRPRVVYVGPRGGKYVKQGDKFVPLKSMVGGLNKSNLDPFMLQKLESLKTIEYINHPIGAKGTISLTFQGMKVEQYNKDLKELQINLNKLKGLVRSWYSLRDSEYQNINVDEVYNLAVSIYIRGSNLLYYDETQRIVSAEEIGKFIIYAQNGTNAGRFLEPAFFTRLSPEYVNRNDFYKYFNSILGVSDLSDILKNILNAIKNLYFLKIVRSGERSLDINEILNGISSGDEFHITWLDHLINFMDYHYGIQGFPQFFEKREGSPGNELRKRENLPDYFTKDQQLDLLINKLITSPGKLNIQTYLDFLTQLSSQIVDGEIKTKFIKAIGKHR